MALGAMVSSTVIFAVSVSWFPLASVMVITTVLLPVSAQLNNESFILYEAILQLSVEP